MASEIRDTTASYSDASQAHWEGAKVVYGDTDSVSFGDLRMQWIVGVGDGRALKDPETMWVLHFNILTLYPLVMTNIAIENGHL